MKREWLATGVLLLARMIGVVYGLFGLLILPTVGYFVLAVTLGSGYGLLADWRVVGLYAALLFLSACGFTMMYPFLTLGRRGRYVALVGSVVLALLLGVALTAHRIGPDLWLILLALGTVVTGVISLSVICYVPWVRHALKNRIGDGVPT